MTRYFTDGEHRHLVCYPHSVAGLHAMAAALGIKRCWYHAGRGHYDVPKRRVGLLGSTVEVVSPRVVLSIMQGGTPPEVE